MHTLTDTFVNIGSATGFQEVGDNIGASLRELLVDFGTSLG